MFDGLQGWETWSEITTVIDFANSQPAKVQFFEIEEFPWLPPKFDDVLRVLRLTKDVLRDCLEMFDAQFGGGSMQELVDVANITFLRSAQVLNLALFAKDRSNTTAWNLAEAALQSASQVMARRMAHINVERIASWRKNPTAYQFTYLWTAKSLYFFWRDRQQLVNLTMSSFSPCLMNIQNAADISFGEGIVQSGLEILRKLIDRFGNRDFGECLAAPSTEPIYPRDAH